MDRKRTLAIVMPVSRADYLDQIFESINNLDVRFWKTKLYISVDGDKALFDKVMSYETKMPKYVVKLFDEPAVTIEERRERIAEHHNWFSREIDTDYVFGMEDDSVVPSDAVMKMVPYFTRDLNTGIVYGVELGRWGVPYVGIWKVDNLENPTKIDSVMPYETTEVDSGGLYCFMTQGILYKSHWFRATEYCGPDIDFGIETKKRLWHVIVDWSINVEHLTSGGLVSLDNTEPRRVSIVKIGNRWATVKT